MKGRITPLILLGILFLSFIPGEHTKYPKNYFRSPVELKILLAGSFGEIRKNHFHSGIDIRTDGVTGKPVFAAADGYISRINISSGGFGKAVYINHPNGFTTVYGHLQNFNSKIGGWIRAEQYKQESFEIDIQVPQGTLLVKKGELIAYSGNSGASGGPHLHFEIRDGATQDAINPLLFGLPLDDGIPPSISNVRIYPYDENSLVNFANNPVTLHSTGTNGIYTIKAGDTVKVSGNIIFGIQTIDHSNESGMKNGVTGIRLKVDTSLCFEQNIDRFAFAATRYVNSVIDYPALIKSGATFERSYIAPNNKINIYGKVINRGIVHFSDNKSHRVEYIVNDVFGNTSHLVFWVKSHLPAPAGRYMEKKNKGTFFNCKLDNKFTRDDILLELPGNVLYEDLDFVYSRSEGIHGSYAPVYHLQDELTPLHTFCTLSIRPTGIPKALESKALIVKVDEGGHFSAHGGKWENGWVKGQIREFGDFTVAVDTTPPMIRPVNITSWKNVHRQRSILMKIYDDLSGIKSYRGTLNGKWILMDYDAKNRVLTYTFDERIKPGKNEFNLVVKDQAGNETVYKALLIN